MKKNQKLVIVDLFCGAGGFSTAAIRAVKKIKGEISRFVAVNHWDYAIATHSQNHPFAKHMREAVDAIDPKVVIPGKNKRVHLLLASPECTHHSNAAGNRPINDQSRVTAWHVLKWLQEVYVDAFIIENVREFLDWGPLGADMRPMKSCKGETFRAYIAAMHSLGYKNVEWRVLNCADYGDPTSRERLFIMGRRDGRPIVWPEPTHASPKKMAMPQLNFFVHREALKPWRTAREIIDWSIRGKSIFNREAEGHKPLAPNTMNRIFVGLRKYGLTPFTTAESGATGSARPRNIDEPIKTITADSRLGFAEPRPFVVKLYGTSTVSDVDAPLPTVTADGNHLGIAQAFVLGQQSGARLRSVDEPVPTIATAGAIGLAKFEPFMVNSGGPEVAPRSVGEPMNTILTREHTGLVEGFVLPLEGFHRGNQPRSLDEPIPTITQRGAGGIVQPYLVPANHGRDNRTYPIDGPMPTITALNGHGLAEPFVIAFDQTGSAGKMVRSVDEPMMTITTKERFGLAQPNPFIIIYHGASYEGGERVRSVDAPFPTVTAGGMQYALLEPWLTIYNGTSDGASIDKPFPTVTGTERMALAVPVFVKNGQTGYLLMDILYRMFEAHELAAAMSFPKTYRFVAPAGKKMSKKNKVKMIGNAVPGMTAESLCRSQLLQLN